jgi:hypothetical protein
MGVRWRLAGSSLCLESGSVSVSIEGRERACYACVTVCWQTPAIVMETKVIRSGVDEVTT